MVQPLLPNTTNTISVVSAQGHLFLGRLRLAGRRYSWTFFLGRDDNNQPLSSMFQNRSAYGGCRGARPCQPPRRRSQESPGEDGGFWVLEARGHRRDSPPENPREPVPPAQHSPSPVRCCARWYCITRCPNSPLLTGADSYCFIGVVSRDPKDREASPAPQSE